MIKGTALRLAPEYSRYSPPMQISPKVYCPVCGTDFPSDQPDAHILKHTLISTKVNNESVPTAVSPGTSSESVAYPMI